MNLDGFILDHIIFDFFHFNSILVPLNEHISIDYNRPCTFPWHSFYNLYAHKLWQSSSFQIVYNIIYRGLWRNVLGLYENIQIFPLLVFQIFTYLYFLSKIYYQISLYSRFLGVRINLRRREMLIQSPQSYRFFQIFFLCIQKNQKLSYIRNLSEVNFFDRNPFL